MPGLYGQASMGSTFSDGIRTGGVNNPQYTLNPGILNACIADPYIIAPAAANNANVAAAQTAAAAGYLTLTAAAGVTAVTYQGVSALQLDVPRAVSITGSGAGVSAFNWTVYGWDVYGNPVGETRAFAGGAITVNTQKTYAYIYKMYVSAGTTANVTAGTADIFGLPFVAPSFDQLVTAYWDNTALTKANFTAAVSTTASATTGDVRGTINVPSASGLGKRLVVYPYLAGNQPPVATQSIAGLYGVTQFMPALI